MKILFLSDNFPPESNAPATRTYEHCVEWVKKGADVTVITCAPNFPKGKLFKGYKNKLYQKEIIDGIKVIRVWTYITPNRGIFKRILDYISFCMMSFFVSLFVKTDLIVATSPQLFTAVSGYLASFFKRKRWIMEVRDLWPDSIQAVEAIEKNTILKILDRIVLFLYRNADQVVVVTDSFKKRLIACGINEDKIKVIKNGVHQHKFEPRAKDQNLILRLGLEGKMIVSYIGTLGMAHGLDFILNSASKVQDKKIQFLLVGEGAMKSRLLLQKDELDLKNVTIIDGVPKNEVADYISISDISLINLRKKNTFTKVIPSKIFENAAMLKPILLGLEGEACSIINQYNAGLCFEPENEIDFLDKLGKITMDIDNYKSYQTGCKALAADFDREKLADQMLSNFYELKELPALKQVAVEKSFTLTKS